MKRRPSRESDMLKIALSDAVAPKFAQYISKYRGDFVAAVIAYSADLDKEWWEDLAEYVAFCEEVRRHLERLHQEGRPIKRSVLLKIKEIAAKYDENVRRSKFLILASALAGVKVDALTVPEYAKSVRVYIQKGKWWEKAFELPVID